MKHLIILILISIVHVSVSGQISTSGHNQIKKHPNKKAVIELDTLFGGWVKSSIPRTESELEQMDSTMRLAYEIYEKMITDSTLLCVDPNSSTEKYFFIPSIEIEFINITDSINNNSISEQNLLYITEKYPKYTTVIKKIRINDFRPKVELASRKVIYLKQEIIDSIKQLNKQYYLDEYLNRTTTYDGNYFFYFKGEMQSFPSIEKITIYKNTNDFIAEYQTKNTRAEQTWFRLNDKQIEKVSVFGRKAQLVTN